MIVSDTYRIVVFHCTMHFAMAIAYLSLKKMNCKFHLKKKSFTEQMSRTKMLVPASRFLPVHNTAFKCNFSSSFSKATLILSAEKRRLQGELYLERYLIV